MINDEGIPEESLKLRRAIYKLKVENARVKNKLKSLSSTVRKLIEASGKQEEIQANTIEADKDYDEIGRNYILVGGPKDPLSIRYDVFIKDEKGIQHKSAERYYWYKKAEKFNDTEAMKKIKDSTNSLDAENAMKEIKDVKEKAWDEVKLTHWEEAQRLKFQQVRWIGNLLIATGSTYIAISSRDKQIGTGWNKKREESSKPYMWDGENLGGKFLMNYRQQMKLTHVWMGPDEEQQAKNKVNELRNTIWRRARDNEQPQRINVLARRTGGVPRMRFNGGGGGGSYPRKQYQQTRFVRESRQPVEIYQQPYEYSSGMPMVQQASNDVHMASSSNDPYTYGQPPQGYTAFY